MRASEAAYERLRDDIVTWRRRPGSVLSEIDLAAELGVSRTPLRSALARLAMEGLVDTSRRTAVVSAVSADGVREQFEVREPLEVQAGRLAARRGDPAVFAALAARFAAAASTLDEGGIDAYYAVVADFDEAVADAVGNSALRAALAGIRTHLQRARRNAADDADRLLRAADEHRLICAAIRDRDEVLAASATTVHLRASLAHLLDTLDRAESAAAASAAAAAAAASTPGHASAAVASLSPSPEKGRP
ncbi:GntR family transcriptional regulator [Schumannella luteola]|uniref:DNA-binding GntR family transcriptional regulator n=1 Tax=Schumannella luteola TaxID=472059 RepID=A0A852Y8F9_9MICO|nr:GntR family transcriptional regulator [Schumannella luteola]NYG97511.1 DNA-binding GntR family transcriptional regulator [Schumannella luteola]TPX01534.1 GntR family transcriptional regulator [Schumannella luteola]